MMLEGHFLPSVTTPSLKRSKSLWMTAFVENSSSNNVANNLDKKNWKNNDCKDWLDL